MQQLITLEELVEKLRLSKSCIYKMTSARRIPFCKLSSRLLFDVESIQAWVKEHSVEPIK